MRRRLPESVVGEPRSHAEYVAQLDAAFFADPERGARLYELIAAVSQAASRQEAQAASAQISALHRQALAELNTARREAGLPPFAPQPEQLPDGGAA